MYLLVLMAFLHVFVYSHIHYTSRIHAVGLHWCMLDTLYGKETLNPKTRKMSVTIWIKIK